MDPPTVGRPSLGRGLALRMALVAVFTPLVALGLLALVVILLPTYDLVWLAIGLAIGLVVTVRGVVAGRAPRGVTLSEADDPDMFALLDRLCVVADIDRPEVVLSAQALPNSWVVHLPGRRPRLFITRALRELLDPGQLQAVLAHELSHVANHDALVVTIVGLPGLIMRNARGMVAVIAAAIGLVSHAGVVVLTRQRELAADAGAAVMTGRPSALASALLAVSDGLAQVPSRDLRAAQALNAFNLVEVPPRRRWWHGIRPLRPLIGSGGAHPPLQRRLDALAGLEAEYQRRGRAARH